MAFTEKIIYYFDSPGPHNTVDAARFAVSRAKALGLSKVVVASTSGETALKFYDELRGTGLDLIVVTHVVGFTKQGIWEFRKDIAERLTRDGVRVVTGTHVLSGLERAISRSSKVGGGSRTDAIAESLRRNVAVGLKVAIECTLIAADQGAIGVEDEIIAVGGTMSGSDTVCVIRPSHTASFFDLQVREIVAMPRNR